MYIYIYMASSGRHGIPPFAPLYFRLSTRATSRVIVSACFAMSVPCEHIVKSQISNIKCIPCDDDIQCTVVRILSHIMLKRGTCTCAQSPACLSASLPECLSACMHACLPACMPVCMHASVCPSVRLSLRTYVRKYTRRNYTYTCVRAYLTIGTAYIRAA